MRNNQILIHLFMLILLAGCSSSGEAPIRYYVVEPIEQDTISDQMVSVHIVDLHIPQYLERFQMVMRSGRNELIFSDSQQWGENLRKNLLRVMSINLSTLMGSPDVSTPLTRSKVKADFKVKVFIERFDQSENGQIVLDARYQIIDERVQQAQHNNQQKNQQKNQQEKNRPQTFAFHNEVLNPSRRNYGSMVESMGQLFNELSIDIARHLASQISLQNAPQNAPQDAPQDD